MRKVIALILVFVLLMGGMIFVHAKIWQLEDDVVFTEEVLAGDPRWMEGKTAEICYRAGQYLRWDSKYNFGTSPSSHTSFHLLQKSEPDLYHQENGFGTDSYYSTYFMHAFQPDSDLPMTQMILDAAAQTPAGESRENKFRTIDYMDNYLYRLGLSYASPTKYCSTSFDCFDESLDESDPDKVFYQDFTEQFRFPVSQTDTTLLTMYKNEDDTIDGLEFQQEENPSYGFDSTVTEDGLYLIPYFTDADGNPLKGSYPDGRGLYFLPWEIQGDATFQYETDGKLVNGDCVMPDIAHLRKLVSIADEVSVIYFEVSQDEHTAWILTEEADSFYLNVIEIPGGTVRNRIQLMEKTNQTDFIHCSAITERGYMVVSACGKTALIDLEGNAHLEFLVNSGAAQAHMHSLDLLQQADLRYEDGVLTLLQQGLYQECSFFAVVFTADGLQFLANYTCSLDQQPSDVHHFAPSNHGLPVTLR